MTPDRANAILDSWCAMSAELLDNACLSEPARLAIDELKMFRRRERLVQELARFVIDELVTEKTYTSFDEDLADAKEQARVVRDFKV